MKNLNYFQLLLISIMLLTNTQIFSNTSNVISVGEKLLLTSKFLNESREVYIHLPETYGKTNKSYPVLYTLDGNSSFIFSSSVANYYYSRNVIPELIVVSIPNKIGTRNRDFTPTKIPELPNSGGAENFTNFLTKELIPFIDNNFKTSNYKILFGHSLCGMYTLNTMLNNNDLFNAYIAASPYLSYDNNYTLKIAEKSKLNFKTETKLYMTLGNEPTYEKPLEKFQILLKDKTGSKLNWKFEQMKQYTHSTVTLDSLEEGLKFIFNNYNLPSDLTTIGLSGLLNRLENLEKTYGNYTINKETIINLLGYQYLNKNNIQKAIKVFKHNIKTFPNSSNVFDSLGEAYEKTQNYNLARINYIKAIKKATETNSPNLQIFKQHLKRVENIF